MSPADHNKTLIVLYSLLGGFFTLPLVAAPLIIAKNVDSFPSPRRDEQIIIAVLGVCVVLCLVLLFFSIAAGLYGRKIWSRNLALVAAVVLLPLCLPIAVYTWWFMHSEGGKQLYTEARE